MVHLYKCYRRCKAFCCYKECQYKEFSLYYNLEIPTCNPFKFTMDNPILIVSICMGKPISIGTLKVLGVTAIEIVNGLYSGQYPQVIKDIYMEDLT